ncbi:hypothetical protein ACFLWI_05020, partial [Chloroflexota bacterium]
VDYITKPFELEKVNSSVEAALKAKIVWREKSALQEECAGVRDEEAGWTRYLDDIAEGVETRLDSLTGHVVSIAVIEQTIDAARCLKIPEEHIEKWVDARRKHIKRIKILDSLLEKGEQSPVA